MRESRNNLGTPVVFIAGALCGAALAAIFESRSGGSQRNWMRRDSDQNVSDEMLHSHIRELLAPVCDVSRVEIEAREGHVNVWGDISHGEASELGLLLRNAPGVTSYYVQAEDNRDIREIADERGIPGRERVEQSHAA